MRLPSLKNSCSASRTTAMAAATTSGPGPHQIKTTTIGIKTAAVRMRRSILGLVSPTLCAGSCRAQTAVTALALLVVDQGLEKFRPEKIRPESFGNVNFGIGNLPEQEIGYAHFAAGADEQIGIGQAGGVEMFGDGLFVGAKAGEAIFTNAVEDGVESVYQLSAAAVI